MSSTLDAALRYAEQGFQVFPCRPLTKEPATAHGYKDATTDRDRITEWWTRQPTANIGLVTGNASGVIALDFDTKKGQPGADTFKELQAEHGQLLTRMQQTPSGGWHLLFQHPGGTIKNRAGVLPGLDVRADGGYIVAPPSATAEGAYQWVTDADIAPLPAGLRRLVEPDRSRQNSSYYSGATSVLDGVPEGQRDTSIYRYACGLQARGMSQAEAEILVRQAAANCVPPFSEAAALKKVERVYAEYGEPKDNGWQAPEPITLDEWEAAQLTPPCIVEDLYWTDLALRVAPGGTGKTTLTLYEAVHIALGLPLYGLKVYRPGPVVIVTAEDRREQLVARLRRLCETLNLSGDQTRQLAEKVCISDVTGLGLHLVRVVNDLVLPAPFADQVVEGLKTLGPAMVVFDPSVSFGVGETRVNDAAQGLVEAGRRIIRGLECCVQFIHHTGQQVARDKLLDQYAGRGGSAFADGCRMVHVMQPLASEEWTKATGNVLEADDAGLILGRPKLSYSPPQLPLYLKRSGYLFECVPTAAKDPLGQLRRDTETVLDVIRSMLNRGEWPTKNKLEHADLGIPRQRVRNAIADLMEDRRVEEADVPDKQEHGTRKFLRPIDRFGSPPNSGEAGPESGAISPAENTTTASPPPIEKQRWRTGNSPSLCFPSIGSPASNGEPAANRGEPATSSIVRQYSDRVKVAQYGGQSSAGSYPPGLIDAAVWACSGLAVSAGEFLASLDPNDYDGVIASPEVARAHAKAIGG